ncbi:MAG: hypothetical protein COA91_05510 [Robiginitomaculum sp.]|nr:MAG: hypothetical protein COA91_05510 [Robiginitomaculum sp.]
MFKRLRTAVVLAALAVSLYQFNTGITAVNRVKLDGQTMLLQLRPVDPRALMLGDYMTLGYDSAAFPKSSKGLPAQGTVILKLDDNNVGTFARRDDSAALADGEVRVKYALKRGEANFGSARFYFQEGTAKTYEVARYGVFKVSNAGHMILVDMAGEDFKILVPDTNTAAK